MTPLELSTGLVLGQRQSEPSMATSETDPISALEGAIRPALEQPPCLVSFSGGLDSSLILATAIRMARRDGLPEPIPATYRIRDAPSAYETDWQEAVARELDVSDWEVMDFVDELDVIGPFATELLLRHGVLFPFNAHGHLPLIRAARGGSLITGAGGDELFSLPARARAAWVLRGRVRPRLRDPLRIAFAGLPSLMRAPVLRRRFAPPFPWLTRTAFDEFRRQWAAEAAREPARWDESRRWWLRRRYVHVLHQTFALLANDEHVTVHHPFCHPTVVNAVAARGGATGWGNRNEAMSEMFGTLLPRSVAARRSMAIGNEIFFSHHSRAFVQRWNGQGIDHDLVDEIGLRREWSSINPDAHTYTLLQVAWLASEGSRSTGH